MLELNAWPKLKTWQFRNLFQETSIDSIAEEAPASAVKEVAEVAEEEDGDAEEAEIEAEAESAEKSPRDGAAGGAAAQTEAAATKIRFDDFLNLMEVF